MYIIFCKEQGWHGTKKKIITLSSVSHSDTLDSSMKTLKKIVKDLIPDLQVK